jgi:hypothetical protein
MRHLAGWRLDRRAVGLTLSLSDVLGSLRFGFPSGWSPSGSWHENGRGSSLISSIIGVY